ncbi:branched-chain amino acid ABC transporter permease [Corticibacterium sp. UT-5YL-CI-8]|nr:branched-chain amino acid ABC transporter permease [Tianweitania sp. UT-5YL-CI-8]
MTGLDRLDLRSKITGNIGAWIAVGVIALVVMAAAPAILTPFQMRVGMSIFFSAGLAVAWGLLGGYAGYYSFGHTAFLGIGAFTGALLSNYLHAVSPLVVFGLSILAAVAVCGVLAALIAYPVLRLRHSYFAIVMLGIAYVAAEVINNFDWFQGSIGIVVPQVVPRGMRPEMFFYYALLAAAAICVVVTALLVSGRVGYALMTIREDEDTAKMLGIATERYKILAFVVSAMLTSLVGVVYAFSIGFITTGAVFRTDFSLNMIVCSLIGGIGTIVGPVFGAIILTVLTQVVLADALSFRLATTGALIVIIVLLAPSGVLGLVRGAAARIRQ